MKRQLAFLCGRGVARSCGFSWEVTASLLEARAAGALPPAEVHARVRRELSRVQDAHYAAGRVSHRCIDALVRLLRERLPPGWQPVFVTTNWDTVLDKALAPHGFAVLHLNGSIDDAPQAPLLMEGDGRAGSGLERHPGFRALCAADAGVLAGVSLKSRLDRELVSCLGAAERPRMACRRWTLVNEDGDDLRSLSRLLRRAMPRARVLAQKRPFAEWVERGGPGLPPFEAPSGPPGASAAATDGPQAA